MWMNKLQNVFVQNQNFILGRTQLFDWKLPEWKCCNIFSWSETEFEPWFGLVGPIVQLTEPWVGAIVQLTGPIQQQQPVPPTAKLIKLGRISIGATGDKSETLSKSFIPASDCFWARPRWLEGGRGRGSSSMEGRDIRPLGTRNPRFLRPAGNPVEIIWNLHWPCKV